MTKRVLACLTTFVCSCSGAGGVQVATAVQVLGAKQICADNWRSSPMQPPPARTPGELTALLTGAWVLCTTTGTPLGGDWLERNTRDFQFTSQKEWYGLEKDETTGALVTTGSGPPPFSGTYSFGDEKGNPLSNPAGNASWVLTGGSTWFQPLFMPDGKFMQMEVVDGSSQTYAKVP